MMFPTDAYPYLVEFSIEHIRKPGYDLGNEFELGLSEILDGITRSMPANDNDASS
jgi:hypothetical protein